MSQESHLRDELVRTRAQLLALLAVGQSLRASADLSTLYHVVATQIDGIVHPDSLFIALYHPENDTLRFVYSIDEGLIDDDVVERRLDVSPINARIIRTRQAVRIDDLDQDAERSRMIPFGNTARRSRSWLGVPLISGTTVQGVLSIQGYQPAMFNDSHIELLTLLASQVGVAIENARLFEKQRRTIMELSTPVIPVLEGVLVLPLIGTFDSDRANRVLEQALQCVVDQQADLLLLDVTGVALVDAFLINQLTKIVRAVSLLGARSIIVGISALMATSAINLGFDFADLTIYRDLRSALATIRGSARE